MTKFRFLTSFCAFLFLFPAFIPAALSLSPMQPAATVNQQVITVYDLQQRIELALLQSQSPRTKTSRLGIASAVIESMILEKLHLEEAEKQELLPSTRELRIAIEEFERERSLNSGELKRILSSQGIDFETFEDSMRARIAWENIIQQVLSPQIEITDNEIDRAVERERQLRKTTQAQEVRLLMILFPDQSPATKENAESLRKNILQGASFSQMARQFSADISAQYGGDLGWMSTEDLFSTLQSWLVSAQDTDISPAMNVPQGTAIFQLKERRRADLATIDRTAIHSRLGNIQLQSKLRALERQLRQEAIIKRRIKL